MMDDDECGAVSGMLGRGNKNTWRKPAPLPLCMDSLDKWPNRHNLEMRFGTWNVKSLYRAGSLMTVSKYKLDLVGVRKSDWNVVAPNWQENTHFSMEKGMKIMNWYRIPVHKRIVSAVKKAEYVSDRMSYIILRGSWCHIIVLYVHASTENITDDVKDSFYEELECVFDKFPKYHMNILLEDFSAKVGREDIFKPKLV
jgi:hypothetical protein